MKIQLKPDLRVATAMPYTPQQIPGWVDYVDSILEMKGECGELSHDDENDPGGAVQLQQLAFMARMMATIVAQQKQIEELQGCSTQPAPEGEETPTP